MNPKRIQRRRTKGWRMPEGAIYVGRPSLYGNPFVPSDRGDLVWPGIRGRMVANFRGWFERGDYWIGVESYLRREQLRTALPLLRGHDLACWCPLDQPCHADVLLELANAT